MRFYAKIKKDYSTGEFRLIPSEGCSEEILQKLSGEKEYLVEIISPRNIEQHRKFFVLLNFGFEHQNKITNKEEWRDYLKIKAGYYTTSFTEKGKIYNPKSMSFKELDGIEFSEFYNDIFDVICKEIDIEQSLFEKEMLPLMISRK